MFKWVINTTRLEACTIVVKDYTLKYPNALDEWNIEIAFYRTKDEVTDEQFEFESCMFYFDPYYDDYCIDNIPNFVYD
jgi:hypothetical protein